MPPIEETKNHIHARSIAGSTPHANNHHTPTDFDLIEHAELSVDVDDRHSFRIPSVPRGRLKELEATIKHQKHELHDRCIQIADLSNVQQQQAEALLLARDAIATLDKSVMALNYELAQRDENTAAIKKELQHSNEEQSALQNELTKAKTESSELLRKNLELSATFNDKEIAIVIAEEKSASLEAKLSAKIEENTTLVAAIEEAKKWYHGEPIERCAQLERRIEELNTLLAVRDEQINTLNGALAKSYARCVELDRGHEDIKCNEMPIIDKMAFQTEIIVAIEKIFRAEREASEQKISELTNEILRERNEHSAAECRSALFRKEIVLLLLRLAIVAATKPTCIMDSMLRR